MSVRARLYLVCTVLIAVLAVPALYGLRQLSELRDIAFDLNSRHAVAFLSVGRLQTSVAELNRLQRTHVASPDGQVRDEMYMQLDAADANLQRLSEAGYQGRALQESARIDSLRRATVHLDSLMSAGAVEAATAYFRGVKPIFTRTQESLSGLAETIDDRSTAAAERAAEISSSAATTSAVSLIIALAAALVLGLISVGALTSPLRRLRAAMATVAGGHFVPPSDLPYEREDEIGDLSRSFRTMTEQLAELDRLKAEFVSIASHELKTPVNVIRGYAEMLDDGFYGPMDERTREILGYIHEQTDVLTERVNQLLSVSRLEARGLEIEIGEVATEDLLADVDHSFQALAAQKEIAFSIEAERSAPASLHLDRSRVRNELLGNLLSNAFKFTPRGGSIRLAVRGEGDSVVFDLRDSGEGIPAAQLPYIFEKYYQAGSRAGKVGAGLGLAIAREIVEAHGGSITAHSEPGVGTAFSIELPRWPSSAVDTEPGSGEAAGRPREPSRPQAPTAEERDGGAAGTGANGAAPESAAPLEAALPDRRAVPKSRPEDSPIGS